MRNYYSSFLRLNYHIILNQYLSPQLLILDITRSPSQGTKGPEERYEPLSPTAKWYIADVLTRRMFATGHQLLRPWCGCFRESCSKKYLEVGPIGLNLKFSTALHLFKWTHFLFLCWYFAAAAAVGPPRAPPFSRQTCVSVWDMVMSEIEHLVERGNSRSNAP